MYQCKKSDQFADLTKSSRIEGIVSDRSVADLPFVVENGKLHFSSVESHDSISLKLETSTPAQNIAWSDEVGFKSVNYYYYKAVQAMSCPTQDCEGDAPALPSELVGKVKYTDGLIEPKLQYGSTGWLINLNGQYSVGQSLFHYTETHLASVQNPTAEKLQTALSTLTSNDELGIDVHPTNTDRDPGLCCPWKLEAPVVIHSTGKYKIAQAASEFKDLAQILNGVPKLKYTHIINLSHQIKKVPGGWNCSRTTWNFTNVILANWEGLPVVVNGKLRTKGTQIVDHWLNDWSWPLECYMSYESKLVDQKVTKAVYNSRAVCVTYHTLKAKANGTNLTTTAEKCEYRIQK
jgi:hypothetical protein